MLHICFVNHLQNLLVGGRYLSFDSELLLPQEFSELVCWSLEKRKCQVPLHLLTNILHLFCRLICLCPVLIKLLLSPYSTFNFIDRH